MRATLVLADAGESRRALISPLRANRDMFF